ncbi:uncharacterized protein LOC114365146 isoform X2 [Ostrinia furnacalis]|uniref:uncharacterized protein LOC114365146 isoform X2 n=1 Tax=Ostrinia furnacalis TaxID=93504 RepID=UPI00103EE076|nr:uncharacterized protein LOC114365146 isoform X2 [Ostrinia furnacalis]
MTAFHHTMWLGKSSSSADHAHAWHGGGGSGGHLLQPTTLTHGTAEVAREVIFFSRPRSRMARRRWLGRSSSSADHAHAWHGGGGSGGHLLQPTTLTHGTAEVAREVIFFSRPRSRMARRRWLGRSSSSADHAHAWHGGGGSGGHLLQPTTLTHGTAEVAREVIFFSRPRSRMARRRWLGRSSSSADHAHAWLGGGGSGSHLLLLTTLTHGCAEVAWEVIFFSRPRSRMARRRWLGRHHRRLAGLGTGAVSALWSRWGAVSALWNRRSADEWYRPRRWSGTLVSAISKS